MTLPGVPLPPNAGPPGAPPLPPDPRAAAGITSPHKGDDLDYVRTAIHAMQLFAEGETDDQDLVAAHDVILRLQKILANAASDQDAATGVTPALKHVRRAAARGY